MSTQILFNSGDIILYNDDCWNGTMAELRIGFGWRLRVKVTFLSQLLERLFHALCQDT